MERKTLNLMLNLRQIKNRKIREISPVAEPKIPKIREISPAIQPDHYKHPEPIQKKFRGSPVPGTHLLKNFADL